MSRFDCCTTLAPADVVGLQLSSHPRVKKKCYRSRLLQLWLLSRLQHKWPSAALTRARQALRAGRKPQRDA